MKTTRFILTILGLALAAAPLNSKAQPTPNPPGQISYQGFLTDANGLPLATNTPVNYNVIFRIFNASTAGTLLWAEQQVVTVDRGYFTVMLGNGSAVSGAPNSQNLMSVFSGSDASDRFLEMTVQGLAPGDPPIAPRLRLLTSPYSFLASKALSVDGSALTTGTVADARLSANVALRAGGNIFSGNQNFTAGDLFLDNTHAIWAKNTSGDPEVFFWPRYADNVTYMDYGSGGFNIRNHTDNPTMFMTDNGNVGIGTVSPGFPLSFANSIGDKLSFFTSSGGNYYGFGIASYQLQIHSDTSAADIVFGYGQSSSFGETMRIKGNGKVGIGTTAPGKMLQVGDFGNIGSEGMIRLSSRSSTGGGVSRTWDIGVPQTGDNTSGAGYSFVINDGSTTDFMVQFGSGNVGIGTVNPANKLDVNGGVSVRGDVSVSGGMSVSGNLVGPTYMELDHTPNTSIAQDFLLAFEAGGKDVLWMRTFSAGGPYNLELWEGGAFKPGGGSWGSVSDIRLKKDVRNLEGALESLLNLRSVTFEFKDPAGIHEKPGRHTGFIAQEVEKVFPEWVTEAPGGMKAVAPVGFESLTVQALRELREEKDAQIQALRKQNEALEKRLQKLERSTGALAQDK